MNERMPKRDSQTVRKFAGTYRGIRYEMNELDKGDAWEKAISGMRYSSSALPRIHWCGYVWIDVSKLAEPNRASVMPETKASGWPSGRWIVTTGDSIWNSAPFHGGCTFTDIIPDPTPGAGPYVKAGCDWNHFFDSEAGFHGDADAVERDLCGVIDWLIERFPELQCEVQP